MLDTLLWMALTVAVAAVIGWLFNQQRQSSAQGEVEKEAKPDSSTVTTAATTAEPRQRLVVGLGAPLLVEDPPSTFSPKLKAAPSQGPTEAKASKVPPPRETTAKPDPLASHAAALEKGLQKLRDRIAAAEDANRRSPDPTRAKKIQEWKRELAEVGGLDYTAPPLVSEDKDGVDNSKGKDKTNRDKKRKKAGKKDHTEPAEHIAASPSTTPDKAGSSSPTVPVAVAEPGWSLAGKKSAQKSNNEVLEPASVSHHDSSTVPAAGGDAQDAAVQEARGKSGTAREKPPRPRGQKTPDPFDTTIKGDSPGGNPLEEMVRDCLRLERMDEASLKLQLLLSQQTEVRTRIPTRTGS